MGNTVPDQESSVPSSFGPGPDPSPTDKTSPTQPPPFIRPDISSKADDILAAKSSDGRRMGLRNKRAGKRRKPQRGSRIGKDVITGKPKRTDKSLGGKKRIPELLIGILLISLGAGAAFLFARPSPGSSIEVLALASGLNREEILSADHLSVVNIKTDKTLNTVLASEAGSYLGLKAVGDIPAGTLLSSGQFEEGSSIPSGLVLMGIRASLGEYPTYELAGGDRVDLVSLGSENEPPKILLTGAEVFSVSIIGDGISADRFVSILVPRDMELEIAAAIQNPIQILKVP